MLEALNQNSSDLTQIAASLEALSTTVDYLFILGLVSIGLYLTLSILRAKNKIR